MIRDSENTKRKLLEAARLEFAARGLAGGRVDTIAAAAKCNKQLIYQHFGSKDGLFDAVFDQLVEGYLENVPMSVDDLADYAARLFDYSQANPELLQLATWYRLERELGGGVSELAKRASADKIAEIAGAQAAGRVTSDFSASEILSLVMAISQIGSPTSSESMAGRSTSANTRQMIYQSVNALVSVK
jgi:AcrR family transcriptional regulator